MCGMINFPIVLEKTCFATQIIDFLGMLLNTRTQTVAIPAEK